MSGRLATLAAVVVALTACVPPLSLPPDAQLSCSSDGDCPPPFRCDLIAGRCLNPDDGCVVVADSNARGAEDGSACELDAGRGDAFARVGHCEGFQCVAARCGDGFLDPGAGELCDAGGANSDQQPDACRTDCTRPRCGDGVIDAGESCDDDGELCLDCVALCSPETGNCDDEPACECTPRLLQAGDDLMFTAIAADGDAVWLAVVRIVEDRFDTRIERHPHSGEAPTTVATFASLVEQIVVSGDALLVRETSGTLSEVANGFFLAESRWSRIPRAGGSSAEVLRALGSIAIRNEQIAYIRYDDDDVTRVLFRGPAADASAHERVGEVSCRVGSISIFTSGCDVAFRGDDIIVRDDQGTLLVAPPDGGLAVLVDVALAETVAVDGDDVYWTSAGSVMRKRGDGPVERLARFLVDPKPGIPATSGLLVAPPYALVRVNGSSDAVVSIDLETGARLGRGAGGGPFAADARGVYWLDSLPFFALSQTMTHLPLVLGGALPR